MGPVCMVARKATMDATPARTGAGDTTTGTWGSSCMGENGATKNLKRRENKAEQRQVGRERIRGALISSYDRGRVTNLWRIGLAMSQFP